MNEPVNQVLAEAVCKTFEDLAFMFPMDAEEAAGSAGDEILSAHVAFAGPLEGSVTVVVDRATLAPLASNMLGLNPGEESTPDQQEEALKKLANTLCGNLLPHIGGEEAEFQVFAPTLSAGDAIAAALAPPAAVAKITLDSGQAEVALYASSLVAQPAAATVATL